MPFWHSTKGLRAEMMNQKCLFKVTKYPQKRKLRCLAKVFVVGFFQSSSVFLEHWKLGLYLVRGFVCEVLQSYSFTAGWCWLF